MAFGFVTIVPRYFAIAKILWKPIGALPVPVARAPPKGVERASGSGILPPAALLAQRRAARANSTRYSMPTFSASSGKSNFELCSAGQFSPVPSFT